MQLVKLIWIDAGARANTKLRDCKPFKAENIGYIVKENEDYYFLQTGQYFEDPEEERDRDITMIPKGCVIEKINILKKGKK